METSYWSTFRSTYRRTIAIIKKTCKITMIVLVIVLSLQTVVYDQLPLISAIETSIIPNLMSIHLCIIFLDDSFGDMTKRILSSTIWKPIRDLIRVSNPFHLLVFQCMFIFLPVTDKNSFAIILHMSFTFIVNFVICSIAQINFEKPMDKFSRLISGYIWTFKKKNFPMCMNTLYCLGKFTVAIYYFFIFQSRNVNNYVIIM